MGRFAQQLEALAPVLLLEDLVDLGRRLALSRDVLAGLGVEHEDVAADLLEHPAFGLASERTLVQQGLEPGRMVEVLVPGVVLQGVLEGAYDVGHGVQAHHVGGAEGGGLGAPDFRAREVVDHIEGKTQAFGVVKRHRHAGGADPVGDEVWSVVGAQHALAQGAGQKALELVHDFRRGRVDRDQLHQVHVTRRVEEMHAAKARLQIGRQRLGELGDRYARGIGREDGVCAHVWGDSPVQVVLPLDALCNGLDDELAFGQAGEVVVVIGSFDEVGQLRHAQRRGALLF